MTIRYEAPCQLLVLYRCQIVHLEQWTDVPLGVSVVTLLLVEGKQALREGQAGVHLCAVRLVAAQRWSGTAW